MKQEVVNTFDEYNHKINGNETIGTIQAMYPVPNHGHRIIIKNATSKGYLEATNGDGIDISSRMEHHRGTVQKGKTQTLTTMDGENNGVVVNDLKIRKLTPRECFRLMGVKDEDFDKVKGNQSDSSLYHLAGDSIVVNVLMSIFKELI
jgi:DNA (cytosine-5)-methyltransferase 1